MYDIWGLHKNMRPGKEQTIKVYMPARAKEKGHMWIATSKVRKEIHKELEKQMINKQIIAGPF